MLDGCFALNGGQNIIEVLHVDQSFQAVMLCKSINKPLPVFIGSSRQVARNADVQDAVTPIGHEINPAPAIFRLKQDVDGRNKSGHDGLGNAKKGAVTMICLYIDADACPVKQEIYRVAERHALKGTAIKVFVVSNRFADRGAAQCWRR